MTKPDSSPLVVITGPTGVGKTRLSLDLAEAFQQGAEIINADSMQLYRGMNIGTAKISAPEMRGIPHHLFSILDVTEVANVAQYRERARAEIIRIQQDGKVPIMVGGSGLYVTAVCQDLEFSSADPEIRAELEDIFEQSGVEPLWKELLELQPEAAEHVDSRNPRRVIRALEAARLGSAISGKLPEDLDYWQKPSWIHLDGNRERIKQLTAERAKRMFATGLIEETRELLKVGLHEGQTASKAIGYSQAIAVIDGELSIEEAIESTISATHRYIRRQRSWFAKRLDLNLLDCFDSELFTKAGEIVFKA
ncbi:MAG: tRNA (adenosine(37)-N6)-dimethylallyltransferase MiaA [Microbacteriaceae bacterium]|nr:tRNA (adenosine(37)-N6)-dimethylallyltransferase MiaA [Microbacteriaceae bacterium]